jgi:hypothetical protein
MGPATLNLFALNKQRKSFSEHPTLSTFPPIEAFWMLLRSARMDGAQRAWLDGNWIGSMAKRVSQALGVAQGYVNTKMGEAQCTT